jgi:hypothetical protein
LFTRSLSGSQNGNESRRINGDLIPELTKTVAELAKTAPAPTNEQISYLMQAQTHLTQQALVFTHFAKRGPSDQMHQQHITFFSCSRIMRF